MYRILTAILITLIWGACANRVPPTGGPKDELPPNLIGSIPRDGNTNVKTTEITLVFDELVTTKNIKKELLITPRINFDYEYSIKKNTVLITLEESLDSATTYTFNFRNSIVDITESNPALNLVLSFSTGSILDTLELKGNINDLFTENPSDNLVVGLYKAEDTLTLFDSPPYYLAKTNKQGNYLFRNLKPAEYIINAFADTNNNLTCESDKEAYAFSDSSIKLDTTIIADTLKLQSLNIDTLQLKRTRNSGQYFVAVATKYITELTLKASNDSALWYTLDKDHKEIKLYNTFTIKDSLLVELTMKDSLDIDRLDTLYLKFTKSERKYDKYEIKLSGLEIFPERKTIAFNINTSKPSILKYIDSLSIKLDTLLNIPFDSTWNVITNTNSTKFEFRNYLPQAYLDSLSAPTKKKLDKTPPTNLSDKTKKIASKTPTDYKLQIPFGSFQSVENDSSEMIQSELAPKYAKQFGILMGNITTDYKNYFIQIVDKNYKVIKELPPNKRYKITHVSPGDYFIRIMIDTNNNGKWDAGNILLNQLPEPMFIYYNEDGISKTTIRANWEISLDLAF